MDIKISQLYYKISTSFVLPFINRLVFCSRRIVYEPSKPALDSKISQLDRGNVIQLYCEPYYYSIDTIFIYAVNNMNGKHTVKHVCRTHNCSFIIR